LFAFEQGYPTIQALIDQSVIGDFRAPNIMRFGFTPLFVDENDVAAAVDILEDILKRELWRRPEYNVKKAVT